MKGQRKPPPGGYTRAQVEEIAATGLNPMHREYQSVTDAWVATCRDLYTRLDRIRDALYGGCEPRAGRKHPKENG